MYTMDNDKLPRKPLIKSNASATQELLDWVAANDYQHYVDCDGLVWNMGIHSQIYPDPQNPHGQLWRMEYTLSTSLNREKIQALNLLNLEKDKRLLDLIGDGVIPLAMKPQTLEAPHLDGARARLAEEVKKVRKNIKMPVMRQIKLDLIYRWIEDQQAFGMPRPLK